MTINISMIQEQNILFIGAGEIGTALAHGIGDRARIELWDKDPAKAPNMRPLKESVPEASVVFLCTPSWTVRELLAQVAPLLHPETIVISLAKGIEEKTLLTMDAVLKESLPTGQRFAILGGPLLAEELMANLPSVGVFASHAPEAFRQVAPLFAGSPVRLEYANNVHGVALAAVLKNVYAVGLGIADGLGWGWNGKGWLAAKAVSEIAAVLTLLGDQSVSAMSSASAGDFLATAMSPDSRNREAGREIAAHGECTVPSEGCRSIPSVLVLLKNDVHRFPFLLCLDRIIHQHEHPQAVFQDLFTMP